MSGIKVGIIGATGYTGSELVRLLRRHPGVSIELITSESRAGDRFSDIHPAFQGLEDRILEPMKSLEEMELDLVFLALPHRVSMKFVRDYGVDRFRIVDLSGDFRLKSRSTYEKWYDTEHLAPKHLSEAVFGLSELNRDEIRGARLVANPGCYPTSAILALAPLLREGRIEPDGIVVDSKSGVTGAGAKAKDATHFPSLYDNFKAYGLKSHRHTPEIEEVLTGVAKTDIHIQFTPHLLPIDRGILTTTYSTPVAGLTAKQLNASYEAMFAEEPFIRLAQTPPAVKRVRGSNYCDIFTTFDERTNRVLTVSVIDNLVKGAAGQAIQNMNLMFGFEETAGLQQGPLDP